MRRLGALASAAAITVLALSVPHTEEPATAAPPPAPMTYANCTEAHQDGVYNITSSDPSYRAKLDRDQDGIACEGH